MPTVSTVATVSGSFKKSCGDFYRFYYYLRPVEGWLSSFLCESPACESRTRDAPSWTLLGTSFLQMSAANQIMKYRIQALERACWFSPLRPSLPVHGFNSEQGKPFYDFRPCTSGTDAHLSQSPTLFSSHGAFFNLRNCRTKQVWAWGFRLRGSNACGFLADQQRLI